MASGSKSNSHPVSWFARLQRRIELLSEAIEISDAERLEKGIAALEANASLNLKRDRHA